jgi:hypothetical protein
MPSDLAVDRSNNNLDACRHDGRIWFAWRTASTHFANPSARLHVVWSTDDARTWHHDRTFAFGRDVREPRFFEWGGSLWLTFFTAGTSGTKFEPDRVWVTTRSGEGAWAEPQAVGPPDTVVWRVRPVAGRLVMSVYRHAGSLYTAHPRPLEVEWWASDDGWTWAPFAADRPVVHTGGSESEFIELRDGRVVLVVRKEGPEGGFGSDIGVSSADNPDAFELSADPRKTDSPLLFLHDGTPILACRRQAAFGGRYDLGWERLDPVRRRWLYQILYWLTPKRTALYQVDPDLRSLHHLADLPSAGDTAFAAEVPIEGGHLVFNYSSAFRPSWRPWIVGQLRPTHIYAVDVSFD